jgi:hypothetical protein
MQSTDPQPLWPKVSLLTATFNRRPFFPALFECFRSQSYPKDKIEWIIADDGSDPIFDLVKSSGISQIQYYPFHERMTLGKKRNFMNTVATGDILIAWDDDDFHTQHRIMHSVIMLMRNQDILCAGSSTLFTYFIDTKKIIQFGPYNMNHSTNGVFAYKKELLKITRYNDNSVIAEEAAFLHGYTIPIIQLNPMHTIVVFSHSHNTVNKREIADMSSERVMKESPMTLEQFFKLPEQRGLLEFYSKGVHLQLPNYEAGLPKYKPDVIEEIDKRKADWQGRKAMVSAQVAQGSQNQSQIMCMPPPAADGSQQAAVPLNPQQIIEMINGFKKVIGEQNMVIGQQQNVIKQLQDGHIVLTHNDQPVIFTADRVLELVGQLEEKDRLNKLLLAKLHNKEEKSNDNTAIFAIPDESHK